MSPGRRLMSIVDAFVDHVWGIPDRPPTNPGAFIIPSYAVVDRENPTLPTCAQIVLATEWWRRYPAAYLIMCTGDNQRLGVTNARVMARYAVQLGVPRSHIVEEDRSKNTLENLRNAFTIIDGRGLAQPTLVTIDLYTRRAVATARKLGRTDVHWLSVRSEGEPAYGWKRYQTRSRRSILLYELGASVFSKLVGWT